MKTMTFNGRTMREAIALAKARFGADVDILDSGAVGDEVQVTVVVPVSRSAARRRRAIEQVSSGINALATAGRGPAAVRTPGAGEGDARPAAGEEAVSAAASAGRRAVGPVNGAVAAPAAGQEEAPVPAAVDDRSAAPVEGGHAAPAEAAPAAVAPRGRKKTARSTKTARAASRGVRGSVARTTDDGSASAPRAAEDGACNGTKAPDPADDGPAVAASEQRRAAPAPAGEQASTETPAETGNPASAGPVTPAPAQTPSPGPLSTLDFEWQRRLRQQGAGVHQAETSPRALVMPGTAAAADAIVMSMPAGNGSVQGLAGEVPDLAGRFAALMQAEQARHAPQGDVAQPLHPGTPGVQAQPGERRGHDAAPAMQQAWAQPVPAEGQDAVRPQPSGSLPGMSPLPSSSVPETAVPMPHGASGAQPAAAVPGTAPGLSAAAHGAQVPRSRLWAMVDSARRMFRRRRLWTGTGDTAEAGVATVPPTGFAELAPMSLASTLGGGVDWPSLQVPGQEAGPDSIAQTMAAGPTTAGAAGPGWFEAVRRRPGQMRLLRILLDCQFSPALARTLVGLLPVDYSDAQADEWLRQTLLRALAGVNTAAGLSSVAEQGLFERGGVFALIGPTGVGKTTSIAKIAAHHVLRHGPRQLALITADVYRIGAQEQLRAFGRMLGVPVQVAQDRDVLQTLLKEHEDRSLVLIDTAGIGQRDGRVAQLTAALELSQVKRVLVMNAAAQAGSLEEVLDAFGARETAGVLLSKVDEAVGLGGCLDAMVRHRLPLVGYTDGQRVPEDYHPANFARLIEQALEQRMSRRFRAMAMTDSELRNLFEDNHV